MGLPRLSAACLALALALAPALAWAAVGQDDARARAREDLEFALDALEERCGALLDRKEVDWRKVRGELGRDAREVRGTSDHLALLLRLLARLHDGHAAVRPGPSWPQGEELPWPAAWSEERVGSGLFFCEIEGELHVRNAWGGAAAAGFRPGMRVLSVDGRKGMRWFEELMERTADLRSFSTPQHRFFGTARWGFTQPPGTKLEVEVRAGREVQRLELTFRDDSTDLEGPAVVPEGVRALGSSVRVGRTPRGFGYVHLRRIGENLLVELDYALSELADAPGLVLDFRGNTGGGCDHDALEARFVPLGERMPRLARPPLEGAGPNPYGGPLVAIVDGTVVSAGETTAGMLKEDGRAYVVGDSPTAGMSSQKATIDLPSGLFSLYVSVASNRSSFNDGRGVEGIGIAPHRELDYDPEELLAGVDTMIRAAEDLLGDPPRDWKKHVRYDPADHGWKVR